MLKSNKDKFDICNITDYYKEGYKGEGIKIAVLDRPFKPNEKYGENIEYINGGGDSENISSHGSSTINVISQIAPEANIYFLPFGSDSLEWCVDNDIDIVNFSASYGDSPFTSFETPSKKLYEKGTLLFTSSGNYSADKILRYPGQSEYWIAVGAVHEVDGNIEFADYSSYTKTEKDEIWQQVEICGFSRLKIVDLAFGSGERIYSGTSCASPFIAGMVALAKQKFGFNGMEEFREWKQENSIPIEDQEGYSIRKGYGLMVLPSGTKEVILREDSREYSVDSETKEMDTEPIMKDNRMLVPIRFISEAFGYEVDWDSDTRKVTIKK